MRAVILTAEGLRTRLEMSGVPAYMHDGYLNYFLHGIPPGDFALAVLTNDLKEACARADETNAVALSRHVYFLYNYAPMGSWGSPEAVTNWLMRFTPETEQDVPLPL